MGLVDISEVALIPDSSGALQDFGISLPAPGESSDTYAFTLEGWVVAAEGPADSIFVGVKGAPHMWRLPLNVPRPDIASRHASLDWSQTCGFRDQLGITRLPRSFELQVAARIPGYRHHIFASIKGSRSAIASGRKSRFSPVMITNLGRTGGNWLMHMLDQHPKITGFRPFVYESRAGIYWAHVFHALAEPQSYFQSLRAEARGANWWLGGNLAPPPEHSPDPEIETWLGRERIVELVDVMKERIDTFYLKVIESLEKPNVEFFVEKCWPESTTQALFNDVYPDAREIFLVRDFRDAAASMLAYGEKRGHQMFGRDRFSSDEDYIRWLSKAAGNMLRAWRSRSDSAYLLKYEDLIQRPSETLSSMLDYIGVDSDAELVEKILRRASEVNVDHQRGHRTSEDVEQSIGRWRSLDDSLQEVCEEAFADVLAAFGYR